MATLIIITPEHDEIKSFEIEEGCFESTILDTATLAKDVQKFAPETRFVVERENERIEISELSAMLGEDTSHCWLEDYFDIHFGRPLKDRSFKMS